MPHLGVDSAAHWLAAYRHDDKEAKGEIRRWPPGWDEGGKTGLGTAVFQGGPGGLRAEQICAMVCNSQHHPDCVAIFSHRSALSWLVDAGAVRHEEFNV